MDLFLIVSAVFFLIFGALLIFSPNMVKRLSDFLNTNILSVEDKMRSSNRISGLILLILSAVIFYLATKK